MYACTQVDRVRHMPNTRIGDGLTLIPNVPEIMTLRGCSTNAYKYTWFVLYLYISHHTFIYIHIGIYSI